MIYPSHCMGHVNEVRVKDSNNFVSVLIDGDCMTVCMTS